MKRKFSLIVAIVMIFSLALTACGGGTQSNQSTNSGSGNAASTSTESGGSDFKYDFKITTPLGDTHSGVKYMNDAFKEIAEKTNGRITGQVYPTSQLAAGDMGAATDMLVKGTIDGMFAGNALYGPFVPEYYLLGTCFLFHSHESADETFYNDQVWDYYSAALEGVNLHLVGYMENAWMVMTNNKRPLVHPSDLKGLKMRCNDGDLVTTAMESQGCSTVTMSLTDLYTALQQGVVDGQDNGIAGAITANKLYEVQKYCTDMEYTYSPFVVTINNELWNKIPAEDQEIITEVLQRYCKEQVEFNRGSVAQKKQEIIDAGVEVYDPTEEEVQEWIDAMGPNNPEVQELLAQYDQDFLKLLLELTDN